MKILQFSLQKLYIKNIINIAFFSHLCILQLEKQVLWPQKINLKSDYLNYITFL